MTISNFAQALATFALKVFYCFVWNYQEPGNMYMYLLEMTEFVVVWFSFVYALLDSVSYGSWADVEEKNIRQNGHWMLETSCKVGLQPEGAHYHSETVIN